VRNSDAGSKTLDLFRGSFYRRLLFGLLSVFWRCAVCVFWLRDFLAERAVSCELCSAKVCGSCASLPLRARGPIFG
jgi:hypothetical protein